MNDVGGRDEADGETRNRDGLRKKSSAQTAELWKTLVLTSLLGFIKVKPGHSGELSYAIILNPYQVIKFHHKNKTAGMREDLFNGPLQRANEIGANDLDD